MTQVPEWAMESVRRYVDLHQRRYAPQAPLQQAVRSAMRVRGMVGMKNWRGEWEIRDEFQPVPPSFVAEQQWKIDWDAGKRTYPRNVEGYRHDSATCHICNPHTPDHPGIEDAQRDFLNLEALQSWIESQLEHEVGRKMREMLIDGLDATGQPRAWQPTGVLHASNPGHLPTRWLSDYVRQVRDDKERRKNLLYGEWTATDDEE